MTNVGHGHIYRRADGQRIRCGGPGLCPECSADLERFAASLPRGPGNPAIKIGLAEIQRTFDRAREAT